MALELTGIENQNEFFSDHYLRTTLETDLREWVRAKREANGRTPSWERLKRLGHPYLKCSETLARARNARERLTVQRDFTGQILQALGFDPRDATVELETGILPLVSQEHLKDRPHVWVVEALDRGSTGGDVMQLSIDHSQIAQPTTNATLERLVGEAFFAEEPPRWILIVSLRVFVLLDRSKWSGRRVLRINWDELYNRPTRLPTFQLVSLLLRRDSLCPESGRMSMLDVVDQQSETHARGVSGSLKYALREAVELLGNEFLHYRRSVQNAEIPDDKAYSGKLTIECLRYMYRLLFLFNVEAQRELAYLPMKASSYRRGYSLEKLRDLELMPLKGDHSAEGYFIHESLHQLFRLVFNGRSEGDRQVVYGSGTQTFEVAPLQCNVSVR